ncbi:sigma-70 family RNA polymerase sigma factor [Clostridium sp. CF012]|uniref:sigma-70 family RNA polymerase sigma factor n=1 Tax=Clostridium sp. CF012 TaxID=2843319 RepID=UPI001C0AD1E0|nr:sigma-70 family RNA polymerase sigma factor [Clostridium sp. CF012]MBU3145480.1 sigma-70 family RNA polymerase sigma factor [Clostridium sp. CF012]
MIKLIELVEKAIKGDNKSFDSLIQSRKENIYKVAYSYVNNTEDALDIMQEVIYKALVSIKSLNEPEYFNTWLTRITINCSINYLNKSKKVISIDEKHLKDMTSLPNNKEEIMDLHESLKNLNTKYKTIIILKYFEDLTLKDISDILKLPLSTVKTQLYRGLEKLKIDLKEAH